MKLPICSQEGRHHFNLWLPADSPLPSPYSDLDHPRKHFHLSCPLNCLFILTLPKTNRRCRRIWTPHHTHVVQPGPSPGPHTQICIWIPSCFCYPSLPIQHCGRKGRNATPSPIAGHLSQLTCPVIIVKYSECEITVNSVDIGRCYLQFFPQSKHDDWCWGEEMNIVRFVFNSFSASDWIKGRFYLLWQAFTCLL